MALSSSHVCILKRVLKWVFISFSNAWKWSESEVTQLCPTLSNPMDCSLPGSSIHGLFQARVLEWPLLSPCPSPTAGVYFGESNDTPLQYSCLENPWMRESGRLQSMGLLRVGHDWATSLSLFTFMHWRRKWQPTPVFLPGESQGRGSLVSCHLWGCTELDTSDVT